MKTLPHVRPSGLTRVELIVAAVVALTVFLFLNFASTEYLPAGSLARAHASQMLSNMKQLHLATQQMAMDGQTTGDATLAWPGDTGGTFRAWATNLVPSYLSTNDLAKLLSAPGKVTPAGHLPVSNNNAILVYAVSSNSPANTIFLSTANFTNSPTGGAIDPSSHLLKDGLYAVMQKGASGAVFPPNTNTSSGGARATTYPTPSPSPTPPPGFYVPLLK